MGEHFVFESKKEQMPAYSLYHIISSYTFGKENISVSYCYQEQKNFIDLSSDRHRYNQVSITVECDGKILRDYWVRVDPGHHCVPLSREEIAIVSPTGRTRIFSFTDSKISRVHEGYKELEEYYESSRSCCISCNGEVLFLLSTQDNVHVYNIMTREIQVYEGTITQVAFSLSNQLVMLGQ